jgi:flagellar motility protein MotE (MotC chaperone)
MVPKKSSTIVKVIAEENDVSQQKVDAIVNFFYKEVRKNLSNISDLKINLPGLGVFQLRFTMVNASIEKIEKHLPTIDATASLQDYHKKEFLEKKLRDLQAVKLKMEDYLAKKHKWKDDKANGTLEKQKTNSRRNN